MKEDLHAKFLGAMIGAALGDAIGEMAFNHQDRDCLLEHVRDSEVLRYTDDTVMTLVLAETLIAKSQIDPQGFGNALRHRYHNEPHRGYGEDTRTIFALVENEGIGFIDAARRLHGGEGSFGNGAAMRIAPVAMFFHCSDRLYEAARAAAEVTHAHPVGIDGAAVLARAQVIALDLNCQRPFSPDAIIAQLSGFARTAPIKGKLACIPPLLADGRDPTAAAQQLGLSIAVQESMPFALYSFLRHPHTFIECVLCAVLHGGDRDTMGSMAGALSGAYLGIDAIPADWQARLEHVQHIETLARELAARS